MKALFLGTLAASHATPIIEFITADVRPIRAGESQPWPIANVSPRYPSTVPIVIVPHQALDPENRGEAHTARDWLHVVQARCRVNDHIPPQVP